MSDKPMTELLRKSGIIDKHITEFEKWRLIDPGEKSDDASRTSRDLVEDLVEEIANLLDEEPIIKQTLMQPVRVQRPPELILMRSGGSFYAVRDEMNHLIVDKDTEVQRGDELLFDAGSDFDNSVIEVEDLYEGDRVVAKMLTIEKVEE